jgi:hypothetical protein
MGLWMGAALIAFGCVSPFYSPSLLPAQQPGAIQTSIVGTANAAMTQTKESQPPTTTPSPTLVDTKTPTVTPTPTATVLFIYYSPTTVVILPTGSNPLTPGGPPTKTSDKQYACDLISRSPTRSVVYDRNEKFNAYWSLRNSGYWYWDRNSVDVEFVSGGHFHNKSSYDLPKNVPSGGTVTIIVPLTAPKKAGEYGATWTLRVGKKSFCRLRLEFTVE